jgi:SAM-dependent methyltransferase
MNPTLIRTESKSACICCASEGYPLYAKLKDRLFGAPGQWNIKRCTSPECALMWLDPAPISDDIHFAYLNYYTHATHNHTNSSLLNRIARAYQSYQFKYKPDEVRPLMHWFSFFLATLPFFREHFDYPFVYLNGLKRGKLLELGVGNGETLTKFLDWGWDAEGLDFDPKAVEVCKKVGLKVEEGDLTSRSFKSETFDAMFSSHVLEHVSEPLVLMMESVRVLKRGGVFVAVTPNGNSALHWLFRSNWRGLEPPRHLNIFTVNALISSAKEAGFSRVKVMTSNFSASGVFFYSAYLAGMKKTFLLRLLSNLARFTLTLIHPFFKGSGEELILVAYK